MENNAFVQVSILVLSVTCLALTTVIFTIKSASTTISNINMTRYPIINNIIAKENKSGAETTPAHKEQTNKYNILDEIPIFSSPPDYKCSSLQNTRHFDRDNKFLIFEDILKVCNQSREKALEYLYKEMNDMRKIFQTTIESVLTFEQILLTLDAAIRCNVFYYPFNSFQQHFVINAYDGIANDKRRYHLKEYNPEVFHYHHRLRFARQEIRDYIKQRDIIDMGAFCGDSMVILSEYTDKTVYSYEFSIHSIEVIKRAMRANNVPEHKVKIINKGLADEVKTVISQSSGESGSTIIIGTSGQQVNLTTIDYERKEYNFNAGFIKGDIEGFEYKAIKGGMNVIKEQRPVIAISMYHNVEGLFGIPKLLRELENYQLEFLSATFENPRTLYECMCFAYPKEILKN